MNKVGKNLSFQTAYRILTTVTPLVTAPYLSRTLGAEMQGVYSFRLSIVSYFTLLAVMGMTTYGTKSIAEANYDRAMRDRCFGELAFVQITLSLFVSFVYFLYCLLFCKQDTLSWILLINMVGYVFDFNWFFYGIQKFSITTSINAFSKIFQVCLIVLLVKDPNDLIIYALIMSITTFLSFGLLIFPITNEVVFSNVKIPSFKTYLYHARYSLILFIPIAAQTIYHIMDKTMLGAISNFMQTGYYYAADKLVSIPIGIIAGICTVMFPRMSELKSLGDQEKARSTFRAILQLISWLSIALCFGIIAVAKVFVPFFYGDSYGECIVLVQYLAFVIVFKSISEGVKTQYLIPMEYNGWFIISVVVGAIINLIANCLFIPTKGAIGAVYGTLLAEASACGIQCMYVIKKEKIWLDCIYLFGYLVIGIIMYITLRIMDLSKLNDLFETIVLVTVGMIIYITLSIVYWKMTPQSELSKLINRIKIANLFG